MGQLIGCFFSQKVSLLGDFKHTEKKRRSALLLFFWVGPKPNAAAAAVSRATLLLFNKRVLSASLCA